MKTLISILLAGFCALSVAAQPEPAGVLSFEKPIGDGPIYVVRVDGMIDNGLAQTIHRALRDAENEGASLILFHVDTFGGLVDAADRIRKDILDAPMPTVAFIDKNAASAGALISYAADRIVMAPGSSIGAATVVEGVGGEAAPDKYQSYMRGLMRATAEANGRDPHIAEAMVDQDLEIAGVSPAGQVLTLSAAEARDLGVSDAIMENLDAVSAALGVADRPKIRHDATAVEEVLRFLGSPVLQSILMLMMLGGLYFELQTPGVGFPGLMAVFGAALFFGPHYMLGLAESWEIAIFVLGVILLLLEIFVIPGFGVAGIAGIVLVVVSLVFGLIGNVGFDFPSGGAVTTSIVTMAVTLVLLVLLIVSLARVLPRSQHFGQLVLAPELSSELGYTSADSPVELNGRTGRAITPLRPAGAIEIDGERVDVITSGEYIPAGTMVRIVSTRGSRVEVRPVERLAGGNETSPG